jgi:hypothetical protein
MNKHKKKRCAAGHSAGLAVICKHLVGFPTLTWYEMEGEGGRPDYICGACLDRFKEHGSAGIPLDDLLAMCRQCVARIRRRGQGEAN